MDSKLLSSVRTTDERNLLLGELHMLEHSLYRTGPQGFDEVLTNQVRAWVAGIIKDEINSGISDKKQYLRELIEQLKSVRLLKITLGCDPSEGILQAISEWVSKNLGTGAVADVEVDESLLGGARVAYEGKYSDQTLLMRWDQAWKDHRKELLEKAGI